MRAEAFEAGMQLAAAAMMIGAFILLLGGASHAVGSAFRATLEPVLQQIRDGSSLTRAELADASVKLSILFAALAAVFDHLVLSLVMMGLLWLGRPSILRLTREENRIRALVSSLSIDLVIGFYVPILLAQILLLNYFLAASMLLVVVALSWPAGGGETVPGRSWVFVPRR